MRYDGDQLQDPSMLDKANIDRADETVGDSAYRRIRNDIIFGGLEPGQKLKLEKMGVAYGTSVSTLRETFNRLNSEGFVIAEGQRGFEVASVSATEFQQIAELRELLEGHALEQSFRRGDLDWEALVVSSHHKLAAMEKAMQAGDKSKLEAWKQSDWQFHRALTAACGSPVLLTSLSATYDRYLRYQMLAVVFRGEAAAVEHRELLAAALARDHAKARALLHSHIHDCVKHALLNSDWLTGGSRPVPLTEKSRKPGAKRSA
jgi:DNA-binding GntR family transcriptional regulator